MILILNYNDDESLMVDYDKFLPTGDEAEKQSKKELQLKKLKNMKHVRDAIKIIELFSL